MKFKFDKTRHNNTLSINSLISEIVENFDMTDDFFIESLREKWPGYVGNLLSSHSRPDRVFRKTLFIAVDHSTFANELSLVTSQVLDKISKDFGEKKIFKIRGEVKRKFW
jgi:hypothetical protein